MTTKITFVYDTAKDPSEFEDDNPHLMAMARAIPGFQSLEATRVRRISVAALFRRTGGRRRPAGAGPHRTAPSGQE